MCHFMSVRISLSLWQCNSSWTRHYYIACPAKCKWISQHIQLAVDEKTHFFKKLNNPKQMQRLHEEVLSNVTATALRHRAFGPWPRSTWAPLVPRSMKHRNIMYWAQFLLIPFVYWFSFSITFWIPFPQVCSFALELQAPERQKKVQIVILASWSSCWFSKSQKVTFRILSSHSSCVTGSKHISAPSTSTKPMLKCIPQAIRATWEFKETLNIDENNIYIHLLYLKKSQTRAPLPEKGRTYEISIRFSNILSCVPIFFNILLHLAHVWMLHVLSMALKEFHDVLCRLCSCY